MGWTPFSGFSPDQLIAEAYTALDNPEQELSRSKRDAQLIEELVKRYAAQMGVAAGAAAASGKSSVVDMKASPGAGVQQSAASAGASGLFNQQAWSRSIAQAAAQQGMTASEISNLRRQQYEYNRAVQARIDAEMMAKMPTLANTASTRQQVLGKIVVDESADVDKSTWERMTEWLKK